LLYTLYTSDLPLSPHTIASTFADDTAIVAVDLDPTSASGFLQEHLHRIALWLHKWRIQVNRNKSTHITFTTRTGRCPSAHMDQQPIPQHTSRQIPRPSSGQQTHVEGPHPHKAETTRPENQGAVLADREEVASLPSKQAVNLQNGAETNLDLWRRTVGLRQQN
jgi:hypothetical protein